MPLPRTAAMVLRVTIPLLLMLVPLSLQAQSTPVLVPRILAEYPHDDNAFTQGLLWDGGALYESTGLWGQSSLRRVDLESGEPLLQVDVDEAYFAEGLERVGDSLIQLTWQAGIAFVYDFETFELQDTIAYEGEGWGLCSDGRYLYMSDGSPYLTLRDIDSFESIFRGAVLLDGQLIPTQLLNELECVGEHIYANAWNRDYIFQIDKRNGVVTALIDARSLLSEAERAQLSAGAVLNGIAYNDESDSFYITGKHWPTLYEVVFVEP